MDSIQRCTIGKTLVHKDGHHFRVSDCDRNCAVVWRSLSLRSLDGFYEEGPRGVLIGVSVKDGVPVGKRLTRDGEHFVVTAFSRDHGLAVLSDTRIVDDLTDWEPLPPDFY